ncbi:ras guanine nucleotide exchange factor domain-containing protein [Globomyces pollinis-pini]|nr:ras guanine nucleotide exchange factor domain-containing protein [Globomyces pollinis-pini]
MTCLLLLKGADPNIANRSNITPLQIAQIMGFTKVAKTLTQCGALKSDMKEQPAHEKYRRRSMNIELRPTAATNPTMAYQALLGPFITGKTTKVAEQLVMEDVDIIRSSLEMKVLTLADAAYLGFEKPLMSVLKPETVDYADDAGVTLLMKASLRGHLNLVKELMSKGCKVDEFDDNGNTAMVWAALGGHTKIVKILHQNNGSLEGAVLSFQEQGIPSPPGQMTPLMASVYNGHNTLTDYLLEQKCDLDIRCGPGNGRSALMIAAWSRRKRSVELLLQKKAKVDDDVEYWLPKGILYMKKIAVEKNAWFGKGIEALPHRKELSATLASTINGAASAPQLRRSSMIQEKFIFFTTEDNDIVADINKLLTNGIPENDSSNLKTSSVVTASNSNTGNSLSRMAKARRSNLGFRQGLNLEGIIGSNSDAIMALAEQMPDYGTELDGLWLEVFQCVVQLVMAANRNIKHHYIAISAKANHCAAEIVRAIEQSEKSSTNSIFDTSVKKKIKEWSKIIITDFPKQLMISTRMAIGVWPPPDAVTDMIKEAASLASSSRELVLLANTLGTFPMLDKKFEVSFVPFEESVVEAPAEKTKMVASERDITAKGGLSYSEYKRQNDLKLIEEMSKKYDMGSRQSSVDMLGNEEKLADAQFFETLDSLLKQFVASVSDLKMYHEQHLAEEFIQATSIVNARSDTIIEEILGFELLKEFSDDLTFDENDIKRLESSDIKLQITKFPTPIKPLFRQALEDVRSTAKIVMVRGKVASAPLPPPNASLEMIKSCLPCVKAVKRLVMISKETAVVVRHTGTEDRRREENWKKECLANERVKQLFQMWEAQVLGDSQSVDKKAVRELNIDDLVMLRETNEGVVMDETGTIHKIKGGRLGKLVELLTSHIASADEDFMPAFILTHHSFTTSVELMDQLFKRYDITPPSGLNQRKFEIYMDKKVVQVRLKVCHVLLYWMQNHFEEDFVDNENLILKFRDFISKKVTFDFENMALQILETLEKKLSEHDHAKVLATIIYEKTAFPRSILPSARFGADPLTLLQSDGRAFLDIDPLEIARQLTLIEFELYGKVQPYECLDQIWESRYRKEVANYTRPAVCKRHLPGSANSDISKMIRHTNEFTFWTSTCIVNNDALKTRVNVLKYFITVAMHCKELNNLTAVTTIVAGLSMGPVGRLHKTWSYLEERFPKVREAYKELQEIVSPKFQYANYRKCLKQLEPPAIPFLGVFLTDLTFCDLGNPDFLPESHFINFDKRRKVYSLIKEIQKYQLTPYALIPVPQIQDFLKKLGDPEKLCLMSEDELYSKSLEVEPKEESSDEEEDGP